tara:strand:+ start:292 stop:639 length:348 start_codon:yes stop_codon:yes gene_type:complete
MNNFLKKNKYFLISIGTVPAAIFRWQIDDFFIVNILGCFFIGIINAMPIKMTYKLIFGFGFCGSLTTFSGWSFHLYQIINEGFYKLFFLNSVVIVLIGLFAISLGDLFAKKFLIS